MSFVHRICSFIIVFILFSWTLNAQQDSTELDSIISKYQKHEGYDYIACQG